MPENYSLLMWAAKRTWGKKGLSKLLGLLLCVCFHSTPQYIQMAHTHSPTQMPSAILILCQISETQLNAHVSSWQMANNQTRRVTERGKEGGRHRKKGTKCEAGYRSLLTTINTNNTQSTTALLHDSQLNHNNSS